MTRSLPPPEIPGLVHVGRLGSGGYADVYLFEQSMPSRKVAVKVMKGASFTAGHAERFAAEANAMASLEHPHIVPVYSAGTTADGRSYLVMMYYPQASLAERVKRERFGVGDVLRIGIQISAAVETAHRANLLHRDIKPANILTSQYGTPGLTDFGIASHMSETDSDDTGVSVPWSPVETLYLTGPATARSDVYSLAATLWHLLVGRSPFEIAGGDNSTFALMRRIRDVPAPGTGRPDVPASLDRLLRTALAKEPQVRPASALAFARALQAIEQELRLNRTEIVLPAEEQTIRAADALAGSEETRLKPQQVVPQASGTLAAARVGPVMLEAPDTDEGRHHTQIRSEVARPQGHRGTEADPDTRLRALEAEEADLAVPGSRARRTRTMALLGLALVLVAVVVFWAVGAMRPAPAPLPPTAPPRPTLGGGVPAPGAAVVTASRAGGEVTFAWTYEHSLPDDSFLVSFGGGEPQPVEQPTVTRSSADRLCARVRVLRADGSNYQREYSPEVCA